MRCMQRLREIGWPSVTPPDDDRRGATVAVPSRDAGLLVRELAERGIVTSSRDNNVRAAFHFYNDDSDVDTFCEALRALRPAG
jgi:selenocysteine lyase/cysteine desulfurase